MLCAVVLCTGRPAGTQSILVVSRLVNSNIAYNEAVAGIESLILGLHRIDHTNTMHLLPSIRSFSDRKPSFVFMLHIDQRSRYIDSLDEKT